MAPLEQPLPPPSSPESLPDAVAAFDGPRGWVQGLRYGFMALPLAFVALPLYVLWPNHVAREFGVPLATLGALLLGVRLLDALIDPALGRWVDALFASKNSYMNRFYRLTVLSSLLLFFGVFALFFPASAVVDQPAHLLWWMGLALALTYLAFSLLTVAHQSWGARLGGTETQRGRVAAWREGLGLVGVVVASVLPTLAGLPALLAALGMSLVMGVWLWRHAVVPQPSRTEVPRQSGWLAMAAPLALPGFRRLLAVYLVNGMASAIPATLVLFFVQDRLQVPSASQPLFLGTYFVCAAASIGLWLKGVARWGLARTWLLGMGLAVAVFAWVTLLDAGDWLWFVAVCALSGMALGADLVLPSALLAGLIADTGQRGRTEGTFMGWWSFATKLNLALAAGLALPLLAVLGYTPGQQTPDALQALTLVYGVLPCALKLVAAVLLHVFFVRKNCSTEVTT